MIACMYGMHTCRASSFASHHVKCTHAACGARPTSLTQLARSFEVNGPYVKLVCAVASQEKYHLHGIEQLSLASLWSS